MTIVEQLVEQIAIANRAGASGLMKDWAEAHGYQQLAEEVLIPTLEQFSTLHVDSAESPLARAYVAAKVAEDAMQMIAAATTRPIPETKGPVIMANIEDDFHALGRRIVTTFLRADGWRVEDMGNDVLATELVDKAEEIGARVIGLSAMMYSTARNIISVREELDKRGIQNEIQLAVGGAVFCLRPELLHEVGGDGTTRTAVGAPSLFTRLWETATTGGPA